MGEPKTIMKKMIKKPSKRGVVQIQLNSSEVFSLVQILCSYVKEESEHYWENKDEIDERGHMIFHFMNLINGLPSVLKKDVLELVKSDVEGINIPNSWKKGFQILTN
jgi:hypothetical protein